MLRKACLTAPLASVLLIIAIASLSHAQYMPSQARGEGQAVSEAYYQTTPSYNLNYTSQQAGYPIQQVGCDESCEGSADCYGCNGSGGYYDSYQNGNYSGSSYGSCNYGGCGRGSYLFGGGCGGYGGRGGCAGQCLPRWFDVYAEAMYLTRDDAGRNIDLISQGADPNAILLSTDDLQFEEEIGVRLSAAYQIGPGAAIEGSYYDVFNWASSANVAGANMFSLFNGFSVAGNVGTNNATAAGIEYSSALRSGEINWKRRFYTARGRVQYSWLVGARYIDLEEDFLLSITSATPTSYDVATSNTLLGLQLGLDSWTCITRRLSVGADMKAGVYSNQTDQATAFATTFGGGAANFTEREYDTEAALAVEGNLMAVFKISEQWSFRGGYQIFYLNGVSLASENINADVSGGRVATINTNGAALYHGGTGGIEFIW